MRIDTYLTFKDQAEAAFTFYQQVLGGTLEAMIRYGDGPGCPDGEPVPDEIKHRIMHACLKIDEQMLMASDSYAGQPYDGIKGCMVTLSYEDNAEAERVFKALGADGKIEMPFEETFWAERFGCVVDRFGVTWGVNGKPKPLG